VSTLKTYNKLLKFMYDEFNRGRNASGMGEYIQVLIQRFERSSRGDRIGNAYNQIGAVRHLIDNGLIDAVDSRGNRITRARDAYLHGRMQPTIKGEDYIQQKRMGAANVVASVLGTFVGKVAKSILGK
jgi:hypothetical protein